MVDKSQIEPMTLIITYNAEHNHPLPTHYNSAAATTLKKYSYSSPSSGRREVQDGETLFDNSTEDTGGHEHCPWGWTAVSKGSDTEYSCSHSERILPFLTMLKVHFVRTWSTSNIYYGYKNGGAAAAEAGGDGAN